MSKFKFESTQKLQTQALMKLQFFKRFVLQNSTEKRLPDLRLYG